MNINTLKEKIRSLKRDISPPDDCPKPILSLIGSKDDPKSVKEAHNIFKANPGKYDESTIVFITSYDARKPERAGK